MVRAIDRPNGRLMAGEPDFESFYAAGYRRLVVQLLGVTGNLHDAEGVVQEVFARPAVRWRQVSGYAMPEAWCAGCLPSGRQRLAPEPPVPGHPRPASGRPPRCRRW